LAATYRGLQDTEREHDVLKRLSDRDADATDAFLRLMELDEAARDWNATARDAELFLAVNPLVPQPHRYLGRASEELGKTDTAIAEYETLLLLSPSDPADIHFRLARLMHKSGKAEAKRHTLQSLEEAPRFLEAHRLLLELNAASRTKLENPPVDSSPKKE